MSSTSSIAIIDIKTEFSEDDEYEDPQIDESRARFDLAILQLNFKEEYKDFIRRYSDVCTTFLQRRVELIKRIPLFWLDAFKRHPRISRLMTISDKDCLRFLSNLELIENVHGDSGYSMKFSFLPNPYFENTTLTKELYLGQRRPSSTSTIIKWKKGYDLSKMDHHIIVHTSRKRPHASESFFKWFVNNDDPLNDDVAKAIKQDIWLKPFDNSDEDIDDTDNDSDHSVEVIGTVKDTNGSYFLDDMIVKRKKVPLITID